jgi:hypothetical protein
MVLSCLMWYFLAFHFTVLPPVVLLSCHSTVFCWVVLSRVIWVYIYLTGALGTQYPPTKPLFPFSYIFLCVMQNRILSLMPLCCIVLLTTTIGMHGLVTSSINWIKNSSHVVLSSISFYRFASCGTSIMSFYRFLLSGAFWHVILPFCLVSC